MMKKVLAEMPSESSEPEVVNEMLDLVPRLITLQTATDDQLVQELVNRGYTGNIIKKVSFIL